MLVVLNSNNNNEYTIIYLKIKFIKKFVYSTKLAILNLLFFFNMIDIERNMRLMQEIYAKEKSK
jgi:hypothetical protein